MAPPPLPWAWRLALPLVAFVSVPFLLPLTLPFILFLRPGSSSSPHPLSFHRLTWLPSPQIPSPPPPATNAPPYPPPQTQITSPSPPPPPPPPLPSPPAIEKKARCDIYDGTWVRSTDASRPLYAAGTCPFVDEAYACAANGRPDSAYTRWRWAPRRCALPPFNATDFLSRLRGRRLVLVGDSMNRNQFESMLCVLRQALPDKSRLVETHGWRISKGRGFFVFKFLVQKDSDPLFNCSLNIEELKNERSSLGLRVHGGVRAVAFPGAGRGAGEPAREHEPDAADRPDRQDG